MKLGLLTAAFPDLTLEEVAEWAGASGFDALEIACWPPVSGERRRYAGVSHIDVERLDAAGAADVNALLVRHGLGISSLAYYPNHLHPDPEQRAAANAHLGRVVDAAALLGVEVVGTFAGADPSRSLDDNLREFAAVWPALAEYARGRGVKIALENCPMLFSGDEWPLTWRSTATASTATGRSVPV
jgi:sugar phosphate isomerase/epimerase